MILITLIIIQKILFGMEEAKAVVMLITLFHYTVGNLMVLIDLGVSW